MKHLALKSWALLLYFEFIMRFRGFKQLHDVVLNQKVIPRPHDQRPSDKELCRAVDLACAFYFKQVLCLQRSAATTLLLRRYGWDAEMVIGVHVLPFKSHAWVEIRGSVVNDRPYMLEMYQVLERI